ncbi:PREDICTED: putative transcription factor bHLH041 [Lupinus angustifolius]|uniref:putative transcription factor bHLH041 n=1 Tax=Lupinus angustifolius TaxID=3871 RepID=UPI00092EEB70|nr:PREDICTED: putative transcription factor bHLH041 [Lupinus angustifolius]
MGCNKEEIELGFSNMSQDDIQTTLRSLFPEEFYRQTQPIIDPNQPSSSSSSLRSLSTGSPEYSSLIFNIHGTSQPNFPETLRGVITTMPLVTPNITTSSIHQQVPQITLSPIHQLPTPENEQDAIMRAMLYVLTSPTSSTSHQKQTHQNLPYTNPETSSAFKSYRPSLGPNNMSLIGSNIRKQSMMNRSFVFFRKLNLSRMREHIQATHSNSTQVHHMISERRRREKLNENFQALRALLPPKTKKDKASILTSAKETLKSLMVEIEKLSLRNQELVSLVATKESSTQETKASFSSNERLNVRVSHIPQSNSSEERMVELKVNLRGQVSQVDILIGLLEFLKQTQNVSLISMEATQGNALHQLNFTLRIVEGSEWDESSLEEAVRRVVSDLIQWEGDQ